MARIGINVRVLGRGSTTGVPKSVSQMLSGLRTLPVKHEYLLFLPEPPVTTRGLSEVLDEWPVDQVVIVPPPPMSRRLSTLLWEHYAVGRAAATRGVQVFHGPANAVPTFTSCRTAVTLYDAAWAVAPESLDLVTRLWHGRVESILARTADLVLTGTESSKRDIVQFVGVPEDRVRVVGNCVDPIFAVPPSASTLADVRQRYGKYFLHVSARSPRKNVGRIVDAFVQLRKSGALRDYHLVIAGGSYHADPLDDERVQASYSPFGVSFAGTVPQEVLRALLWNAEGFIFPSLYEGFGIPILEAMQSGCPVVTSNVGAPAELGADAALLVDPRNVDEIAHAMVSLAARSELREDLRVKGRARAAEFTVERLGATMQGIYEELI